MALPYLVLPSGVRQTLALRDSVLPQRAGILRPGVLLALLSTCLLTSCYLTSPVDDASASNVNNRSFVFANGAVFHAALANVSTTLAFSNSATSFTLSSTGGSATGTNRFGSCLLTVTSSTYTAGAGPQVNDVIILDPCEFDNRDETLEVSNRNITATSASATSTGTTSTSTDTQATASNVNDRSFTFSSGAVFHAGLAGVSTALGFTSNATNFSLSSSGDTAAGTNQFGSCILTVTTSSYFIDTGPQAGDVITLSPCIFHSTGTTLTVTNRGITVTSATASAL